MKNYTLLLPFLCLIFSINYFSCSAQVENCNLENNQSDLIERYKSEQDIRDKLMPVLAEYQKTGEGAMELLRIVNKQNSIDADNQDFVKRLLENCGWSSEYKAEAHKAIFMILHHADYEFMKEYIPLVKEKSELGLLEPDDYPMMLDRVLMNEGKPQLYGTQTFQGKNNVNFVWPVKDAEHLQKRRDSIALPSMKEYFKISKEAYNIEMVWDKNLTIEEAIRMKENN